MELEASQLYADKTWVEFGQELSSAQKKQLLQATHEYAAELRIEGLKCSVEKVSSSGLFAWGASRAVLLSYPLDHYQFAGWITLHSFKRASVIGAFKLLYGEEMFAVGQSVEVRRRVVLDKLRKPDPIAGFFMLDKATDLVADFLLKSVKQVLQSSDQQRP